MSLFYEVNMHNQEITIKDEGYFKKKNEPIEKTSINHFIDMLISFHNPNIRLVEKSKYDEN